ncbi:MAG: hypothetical protein O2955_01205 [Planctomycetota bacterium]|nr:hypothetical protein [Planctomycetota bacterium]MDA1211100.1 hypothetical protein [Planctomycetota bacterium]
MRVGDLSTGVAKLRDAIETLEASWNDTAYHWQDANSRRVEEEYLQNIIMSVKLAIESTQKMNDLLARAHRECSE